MIVVPLSVEQTPGCRPDHHSVRGSGVRGVWVGGERASGVRFIYKPDQNLALTVLHVYTYSLDVGSGDRRAQEVSGCWEGEGFGCWE